VFCWEGGGGGGEFVGWGLWGVVVGFWVWVVRFWVRGGVGRERGGGWLVVLVATYLQLRPRRSITKQCSPSRLGGAKGH